jgi:tRNA U54 and U55 pseudouridine synthase Pus10
MSAIDAAMAARYNVRPLVKGEQRHFETAKRTIDVDVREMGGRPVVLYVDAPNGAPNLIDFGQVKVTPR